MVWKNVQVESTALNNIEWKYKLYIEETDRQEERKKKKAFKRKKKYNKLMYCNTDFAMEP